MPAHLTPEWFDRRLALLGAVDAGTGAEAVVCHVATGGPNGEARWTETFAGGRLVANGPAAAGSPEPTHTVTVGWADGRAIALGQLDANAAYVAGTTKVVGPSGPWFAVLALLGSPAGVEAVAALAADTDPA